MQPKRVYPYKVTFIPVKNQGSTHTHGEEGYIRLYDNSSDMFKDLKEQQPGMTAKVERFIAGTEFCSDFESVSEEDDLYIAPMVELTPINFIKHFFVKINDSDIRWMAIMYDTMVSDIYGASITIISLNPQTAQLHNIMLQTYVTKELVSGISASDLMDEYIFRICDILSISKLKKMRFYNWNNTTDVEK